MTNPRYDKVLAEADAILAELPTTDDPVEKGFICLRSVAHVLRNMRSWEEL